MNFYEILKKLIFCYETTNFSTSLGADGNFNYKDCQTEEDLDFWDCTACRDHPKYPVLSNFVAPYYDFSRKTEFYLNNNALLNLQYNAR